MELENIEKILTDENAKRDNSLKPIWRGFPDGNIHLEIELNISEEPYIRVAKKIAGLCGVNFSMRDSYDYSIPKFTLPIGKETSEKELREKIKMLSVAEEKLYTVLTAPFEKAIFDMKNDPLLKEMDFFHKKR